MLINIIYKQECFSTDTFRPMPLCKHGPATTPFRER